MWREVGFMTCPTSNLCNETQEKSVIRPYCKKTRVPKEKYKANNSR